MPIRQQVPSTSLRGSSEALPNTFIFERARCRHLARAMPRYAPTARAAATISRTGLAAPPARDTATCLPLATAWLSAGKPKEALAALADAPPTDDTEQLARHRLLRARPLEADGQAQAQAQAAAFSVLLEASVVPGGNNRWVAEHQVRKPSSGQAARLTTYA